MIDNNKRGKSQIKEKLEDEKKSVRAVVRKDNGLSVGKSLVRLTAWKESPFR